MLVRFKSDVDRAHIRRSKVDANTAPSCNIRWLSGIETRLNIPHRCCQFARCLFLTFCNKQFVSHTNILHKC